jgi:phosphorylcholine metabolism protein LicD
MECFKNNKILELSPKLNEYMKKNLRASQLKMNYMFKELIRICDKYNLKYWCTGGTLIGVIRHKGWVPWDGDIDIAMLEDDYIQLIKVIQDELDNKKYWFQHKSTDPYWGNTYGGNLGLGKLKDSNSCIENCQDGKQFHNGLTIDIFPYTLNKKYLIPALKINDISEYHYNFIFPLKKLPFEDFMVNVPNEYTIYAVKNWGNYPPKIPPREKRYPHEGTLYPNKICKFHYRLYPNLYKIN